MRPSYKLSVPPQFDAIITYFFATFLHFIMPMNTGVMKQIHKSENVITNVDFTHLVGEINYIP
jgi:hypothetical protein